ncbi:MULTISPECIES: SHOCT domain-containing protein [Actinomadura]|uniref:SHOCT domain-containing protein n=1 Tax=Actinomadura TaxID=1988 RepID=UPI0006852B24|nr:MULTISPECIES: SHOCT domain-containing protein [Actinomadura]
MTMWTTLATQLHPGGWSDGGDAPAFWPVFPVMFGLFWLAVLATGFYFVRRHLAGGRRHGGGTHGGGDPLSKARSVLAERFARGEIDEDEYLRRMSALRADA